MSRYIDREKLLQSIYIADKQDVLGLRDLIRNEETVEAIPIQFIKDQIEDCHYIAGRAIPKVEEAYNLRARHLEDLLSHWEVFGKKWERGEKW